MTGAALNTLSAAEIARGVSTGAFTAEAVAGACLARIAAREDAIGAWAFLDPELALAQARAVDKAGAKGPLAGVPVGIKDIFDTFDMPTAMGSPIHRGRRTAEDASCVALLRAAGAVILGKTVTCEFAGLTPSDTRNPHDRARTPGGSSSGSAAAVADFMVPVAIGSQTGGSVLRPASFCGVVGYKPSYGLIPRGGMKFAAESRDTVGILARTVEDADLAGAVLTGRAPATPRAGTPRIGLCRTPMWADADRETVAAIDDAAERLGAAGAEMSEIALPDFFEDLRLARTVINPFERARAMAHEWHMARDQISDKLRATLEAGFAIAVPRYHDALQRLKACRDALAPALAGVDVLLAPCVKGEAPVGFETTGEPRFQEFWTALHVPTVSLPTHRGPNGMPVGIQLVGHLYEDAALLATARWVMEKLGQG